MCYFGTNNRLLIYALCVILPTGQWGTPHYSQPATEERKLYGAIGHIKHWKLCLGTLMCYFGTNNRLLIYVLCVILPTGQWGTPHYSQPATEEWLHLTGHVKHIEYWKPCLGTLMCYFGTNNRLLIYALCVILPTGQWGTPHYSQPATEEWLHLTGHVKHIEHWKPCLGTLMCHFGTNNRLLIYAVCVILPTGQWRTHHYSQPATEEWLHLTGHVKHIEHWKPCLGTLMCHFGTNNRLLIYALCVILPTGQWRTHHYSQPATEEWLYLTGHVKHIEHWKPCMGALICYFGTNNRLLIYALCVILPTGQWGTPHYSQPTTEEWLHLTAIWGTWNTLNIENHVWGAWCVISVCVIFPNRPASEEHPITPKRPLRNGCIWQHFGARERQ